jgi:phosphoserine aminotransferase
VIYKDVLAKVMSDPNIVELAIKQSEKYGDPHKRTFDIPLYESFVHLCINETCHQMGLALSETEEFRKILLENLEKL